MSNEGNHRSGDRRRSIDADFSAADQLPAIYDALEVDYEL